MKHYFIEKIKENKELLNSTVNLILKEVENGNFNSLKNLSGKAKKYNDRNEELIKDAIKNCTVVEFIEISNIKANYRNNTLLLGGVKDMYSIISTYKYGLSITLSERNMLINRFGYQLKEAKV